MSNAPNSKQNSKNEVWYFAYGSNIKTSVMRKRKLKILDHKAVVVLDYYLTFDIGALPYVEPSFASIERFPPEEEGNLELCIGSLKDVKEIPPVHGVAWLLSQNDYARLVLSEGGGVAYEEIKVDATVLGDRDEVQVLKARTFKAKFPRRPNGAPSSRYMGIILDGCKEHSLPPSYQTYVASLPHFTPSQSFWSGIGTAIFLFTWRNLLRTLVRLIHIRTNQEGHCAVWLGQVILWAYVFMWAHHDFVHSRIFGAGDGQRLDFRMTPPGSVLSEESE